MKRKSRMRGGGGEGRERLERRRRGEKYYLLTYYVPLPIRKLERGERFEILLNGTFR